MLVGGSHLNVGTVMTADIGRDIKGKKTLATIVGIVYGFWSMGTCIDVVTLGYVQLTGWDNVLTLITILNSLAAFAMIGNAFTETRSLFK